MIKLISRASSLAKIQVNEFQTIFPDLKLEIHYTDTIGDRDLKSSLMDQTVPTDFFTQELDQSVLDGRIDFALHSAKDLPYPMPRGLEVISLLAAGDKSDALVSRDGLTFKDLPIGAKLGTSSASRQQQVLELRPDLEIVSIRGTIEARIDYVTRGEVDAVIVATCALNRLGLDQHISDILPITTHPLQGNLAVVAKINRFDLKELFKAKDIRNNFGKVSLVGAGPGDPDLLTVKAYKALNQADVVYYDDLSGTRMLEGLSAELIYVGKRKGCGYKTQPVTNEILYQAALAGKKVVRLKAGDPLLFSRGGEELAYLGERLVETEVVPGISSFQASAATLQFPLTMRGVSRRFTATSGHYASTVELPLPSDGTIALFMSVTQIERLQGALQKLGWDENTGVAIVHNAGHLNEECQLLTIKTLDQVDIKAPSMIIIGEVTKMSQQRAKLLYTGIDPTRIHFREKVTHLPFIRTEALAKPTVELEDYDGLMFTSRSAVRYFLKNYQPIKGQKLFAVGPHTAELLEDAGFVIDVMPEVYDSNYLLPLVEASGCQNVLYPCSNLSDNALHQVDFVEPVVFYKTIKVEKPEVDITTYDAIIFSSASTITSFFEIYTDLPESLFFYVSGNMTRAKLLEYGISEHKILTYNL
ncbi:MAG: uroporphyrinogen-III C-methyltransferase [Lentisphaeria bacterium]|nr:uroporphyrinogen-III C-methyltransferase [Lentisphaeria bacterium]